MLICDLCGGKNKVEAYALSFEIRHRDKEPIGTTYSQDVCDNCYTKLYNMIHLYNGSPALHGVLSKGLDLKQKVTQEVTAKEVADHYNR